MPASEGGSGDGHWLREYLKRQKLPGRQVYVCPYCKAITNSARNLHEHFLADCLKIPTSTVITGEPSPKAGSYVAPDRKPYAGSYVAPDRRLNRRAARSSRPYVPSSPLDLVHCPRCGRAVRSQSLVEHMAENHSAKQIPSVEPVKQASPAELREHAREILEKQLKELGTTSEPAGTSSTRQVLSEFVPCSCGGSNDNCSRCFGKGEVPRHRVVPNYVAPLATPSSAHDDYYCDDCSFRGTALALMHHRRTVHGDAQSRSNTLTKSQRRKKKKRGASMQRCSGCGLWLLRATANDHVCKSRKANTQAEGGWQRCGICGANLKHLVRHMNKVHRDVARKQKRRTAKKMNAGGLESRSSAIDRWKQEIEDSQPLCGPNLDATKDYAHAYRDQGMFGSHPSHDGFDDESTS